MASMVASMMTLQQSWQMVQEAAGISTVSCLAEVAAAAVWQVSAAPACKRYVIACRPSCYRSHPSCPNTFHLSCPSGVAVTPVFELMSCLPVLDDGQCYASYQKQKACCVTGVMMVFLDGSKSRSLGCTLAAWMVRQWRHCPPNP